MVTFGYGLCTNSCIGSFMFSVTDMSIYLWSLIKIKQYIDIAIKGHYCKICKKRSWKKIKLQFTLCIWKEDIEINIFCFFYA